MLNGNVSSGYWSENDNRSLSLASMNYYVFAYQNTSCNAFWKCFAGDCIVQI